MQEVFSFQFSFRTDGRKRERETHPIPAHCSSLARFSGKKKMHFASSYWLCKSSWASSSSSFANEIFHQKKILWLKQLDLLFIWLYALLAGSLLSARCHAMMIYYSASYEKEKRRLNGSFSCEYLRYGLVYTPTKIATRKAPNYASRIYILLILCIG